jgi:hypothetical protein
MSIEVHLMVTLMNEYIWMKYLVRCSSSPVLDNYKEKMSWAEIAPACNPCTWEAEVGGSYV